MVVLNQPRNNNQLQYIQRLVTPTLYTIVIQHSISKYREHYIFNQKQQDTTLS